MQALEILEKIIEKYTNQNKILYSNKTILCAKKNQYETKSEMHSEKHTGHYWWKNKTFKVAYFSRLYKRILFIEDRWYWISSIYWDIFYTLFQLEKHYAIDTPSLSSI